MTKTICLENVQVFIRYMDVPWNSRWKNTLENVVRDLTIGSTYRCIVPHSVNDEWYNIQFLLTAREKRDKNKWNNIGNMMNSQIKFNLRCLSYVLVSLASLILIQTKQIHLSDVLTCVILVIHLMWNDRAQFEQSNVVFMSQHTQQNVSCFT